uniref:Uncharacterized protein n=1 Tax=Leersia perrieri TaxID=77586 RepID=A0A0D9WZ89_9ORYZ
MASGLWIRWFCMLPFSDGTVQKPFVTVKSLEVSVVQKVVHNSEYDSHRSRVDQLTEDASTHYRDLQAKGRGQGQDKD